MARRLLTQAGMLKRLAVVLVLLAGCNLYWSGGDKPPVCNGGGYTAPEEPVGPDLRDPNTGMCQTFGGDGGGGWGCDPACGPCPLAEALPPPPDWAVCNGMCDGLDEQSCLATTGCRAAYLDDTSGGSMTKFLGCWGTAPSGPIEGGGCTGLDAQACSEHDDCSAVYTTVYADAGLVGDATQLFEQCIAEPGNACDSTTCPAGAHCETQCHPCDTPPGDCMDACSPVCVPDDVCATVDCGPGYSCVEQCTNGMCSGQCVATQGDPGSCTGDVTCGAAPPACPPGATPGIANGCYTGYCLPLSDCGPGDPGSCNGPVTCESPQPVCPAGTEPGVKDGCWTGYCIPDADCAPPPCEDLATEAACTARSDCQAVYTGMNCLCYPDGTCTCDSETFARCQSLPTM